MSVVEQLEKLANLKENGVITKAEFEEQKKILLNMNSEGNRFPEGQKEQWIYVLLAFFLGYLGIHNFYAGRWKRGLAQLLITVLTGWLILPVVIVYIWVVINIFGITTDAEGIPFKPNKAVQITLGIILIFLGIIPICAVMIVGGFAGYTMAMNRYRTNQIIDAAQIIASAQKAESISYTDETDEDMFNFE